MQSQERLVIPKKIWRAGEVPWGEEPWAGAATFVVRHFHEKSSNHRPPVSGKIMHDGQRIAVRFDVDDYYLLAAQTEPMGAVYTDSCVEFFIRPKGNGGYFNYEMSATAVPLVSYVTDWRRDHGKLADARAFSREQLLAIPRRSTLSGVVSPERVGAVRYSVGWVVDVDLLEAYRPGTGGLLSGQTWTGNLYKCADATSRPHWGSWSAIGERLNFHSPEYFGQLVFE